MPGGTRVGRVDTGVMEDSFPRLVMTHVTFSPPPYNDSRVGRDLGGALAFTPYSIVD